MLRNERTGEALATEVEVAMTRAQRRKGLLGRDRLDPSQALVIAPCFAIHTAFMRFAIDVVFVDDDGFAVRVVRELPPWRIAVAPQASSVVELPAGGLEHHDVQPGDRIYLVDGTNRPHSIMACRA
jgi:hypothetical protein